MKIINTNLYLRKNNSTERRFRGSIYVDVWIPLTGNIETDRQKARETLEEYSSAIPNSYVGDVGLMKEGLQGIDRDI